MSASRFPLRAGPRAMAIGVLALMLPLAGACSSDVGALRDGPLGLGPSVKPIPAPDFVANSRPAGSDYMPVGVSAPKRSLRAKSSESQKALEAELEGARNRNESRGRAAEGVAKAQPKAPKPNAAPPAAETAE